MLEMPRVFERKYRNKCDGGQHAERKELAHAEK